MRRALALSFLMLLSVPALAVAPPRPAPKPLPPSAVDKLFTQLGKAADAEDAKPIEDKITSAFRASGSASVDLLLNRAEVASAANDAKTAKKLIEAVTTIAPNFAEGWHTRAGLESAAGDDTDALVSLQKVVLLNPRNFTALTELGGMLEDYGDKAGALKLYRQALALDPKMEDAARHVKELTRTVEGQDI